jgi:hypothetical protein
MKKMKLQMIIILVVFNFICGYAQEINYDAKYVIQGNWRITNDDIIQSETIITDIKNRAREVNKIIPYGYFENINNNTELIDSINRYIREYNIDDNIQTIIEYLKTSNNPVLQNISSNIIKILSKNNKTKNDYFRIKRYIIDLAFSNYIRHVNINRRGIWEWRIFIDGDTSEYTNVKYILPDSFPNYVKENKKLLELERNEKNIKFETMIYSNFEFEISVQIFGKNSSIENKKILKIPVKTDNKERILLSGNVDSWRLFTIDDVQVNNIDFIEYTITPSIENSIIISEDRAKRFELSGKGEGMNVKINIIFIDGTCITQLKEIDFK